MAANARTDWTITTRSADETREFGEAIGRVLRGSEVILLTGQLGAGKTTLTQGVALGLGVEGYTKSPSFVLLNEYQGRVPLYHLDLFRIETPEEVWDLGIDEYLDGPGVIAIEWADRARKAFPDDGLTVELQVIGDDERRVTVEANGTAAVEALELVEKEWSTR